MFMLLFEGVVYQQLTIDESDFLGLRIIFLI